MQKRSKITMQFMVTMVMTNLSFHQERIKDQPKICKEWRIRIGRKILHFTTN